MCRVSGEENDCKANAGDSRVSESYGKYNFFPC